MIFHSAHNNSNNKIKTLAVLLELTKVFDMVSHKILIDKLQ